MKKLLIVSRSTVFHNKSGGLETQLDNLINFLKSKYTVTVLTTSLSSTSSSIEKKSKNSVSYIFIPKTIPGEYGYSLYESLVWQIPIKRNLDSLDRSFRKHAAKFYNSNLRGKFDLIVSQSSSAQDFIIEDEKLILINHGTTLNEIKSRWSGLSKKSIFSFTKDILRFFGLDIPILLYEYHINNPALFSKAACIILISPRVKKDFAKQHREYLRKVSVIPNGININNFRPSKKSKTPKAVYFGRIDYEKGLNEFVQVAESLPNVKFEIYGDGTDAKSFSQKVKSLKLSNLKYFGAVPNAEISKILSKSQVFLFLTKRKEGMPMSILEAMSSGCAVVTTLKDDNMVNVPGYIVVKNADDAVAVLKKLLNDEKAFKKASDSSRDYAEKNYSLEVLGQEYLKLFKQYD